MNYTDVRAKMNVDVGGVDMPSETLKTQDVASTELINGQNVLYNTYKREFHIAVNGKAGVEGDCRAPKQVGPGGCTELETLGTKIEGIHTEVTCNHHCLRDKTCKSFMFGNSGQCYSLKDGCTSDDDNTWTTYTRTECRTNHILLKGQRCIGECMEIIEG